MKILAAVALSVAFLGAVFSGVYLVSRSSDNVSPAPAPITAPAVPPMQVQPDRVAPNSPPDIPAPPAPPPPPAPAPDGSVQPPPLPDDDFDDDGDDDFDDLDDGDDDDDFDDDDG